MRIKGLMICAAMILGVMTAITGGVQTLSYFSSVGQVKNDFTFVGENGLDAVLTEPHWDPDKGLLHLPNQIIPKDPQITNTSEKDMDLLTAVKLEFVYGNQYPEEQMRGTLLSQEDMTCILDVYDIDWDADNENTKNWVRYPGGRNNESVQYFYYNQILKRNYPNAGDTTVPLFTRLKVKADVNNYRMKRLQEMRGFEIRISGIAVQQMDGEKEYGLNSPEEAFHAGLFFPATAGTESEKEGETE